MAKPSAPVVDQANGKDRLAALRMLGETARIDELPAVSLDTLGVALFEEGDAQAAANLLRKASGITPGMPGSSTTSHGLW